MRSRLGPLDLGETTGYIQRRLQLSGANSGAGALFPSDTITQIHRYSGGIPRLINTVCEDALMTGYAKQAEVVTPDIIHSVAADLRLHVVRPALKRPARTSDVDIQQAVQTLIEICDRLKERSSTEQRSAAVVLGASQHEPFI